MQEDIHRMMDSIQKIARRGSSSSRVSETPPMLAQERPLMAGPLATQDDCTSIAVSQAADLHNLAEQIYTSADNAVDILNDLLNYDKIEHGELSLELTVIPIWCLLERTRQEFTLAAEAKLIHLDLELLYRSTNTADVEEGEGGGDGSIEEMVVHVADELPNNLKELRVIGDTIRIAQVIRNLVSNAIKFTPERGHVQIKTRILEASSSDKDKTETFELVNSFENHTFEPRGAIQFDVIDSGAGMTEEQLNDLFGQGVQFNVTQLQAGQGSGLGLYIAKGLVEQHGGRLMATSPGLGLGTCFRVILPLHHVPDDKLPSNLRHLRIHRSTGLERHSSSVTCEKSQHAVCSHHVSDSSGALNAEIHILVVDDAAMNRKMLMRLLKNRGYICDQAENGQQALKRVEEAHRDNRRYDSILMDYEM